MRIEMLATALALAVLVFGATFHVANPSDGANLPGDPKKIDPIAILPAVRAFAGGEGVRLLSLEAAKLRRNGTVDLRKSTEPLVVYHFARLTGENTTDIRVELSAPGWRRSVTADGETTFRVLGMRKENGATRARSPIDLVASEPRCDVRQMWNALTKRGVKTGTATLRYDQDGYSMIAARTGTTQKFDLDCRATDDNRPIARR